MAKICEAKGCYNISYAKGYCRFHQYLRTDKKPKAPNLVSKKRAAENKVYSALRLKFLKERTVCEINAPGCTSVATCIHHKEGRIGDKFLKVSGWMATCINCNEYVEIHDKWARERGFKVSRLD